MLYVVNERFRKINHWLIFFNLFAVFFIVFPFLIIFVKSITPAPGAKLRNNADFINYDLWISIFRSISVAFFTLFFVLIISYPFAYLVVNTHSSFTRTLVLSLATSPIWSSFLVKIIGLKSFFDLLLGEMNSTRGLIYVIIALVYINLPIAILTFYNGIKNVPRNIINAALDLGNTSLESVFKIVIPCTKKSIITVLFLIFLPSITCIGVADFMNKTSGSKLIAQIINDLVEGGGKDGIGINRLSFLTLVLVLLIFIVYCLSKSCSQLFKKIWIKKYE